VRITPSCVLQILRLQEGKLLLLLPHFNVKQVVVDL
jgi:hypothetical protein